MVSPSDKRLESLHHMKANKGCVYLCITEMISKNRSRFSNGVVHSFTGSRQEALKLVELGLYIGGSSALRVGHRQCCLWKNWVSC